MDEYYDDDENYDYEDSNGSKKGYAHFHIYIGIIYMAYCFTLMLLQTLIFLTFYKNRKTFQKNMPFKIIFNLGIYSFLQQLSHFISGIFLILNLSPQLWYGYMLSSLLQSSYITSIAFVLLLTINRFDVFFNIRLFKPTCRLKFFNTSIISCHILFGLLYIFYLLPSFRIYFSSEAFCWQFEGEGIEVSIAFEVQNRTVISLLTISVLFYIITFIKIIHMRYVSSKNGKANIKFSDFKILLQALFNFISIVLLELCWDLFASVIFVLNNGYSISDLIYVLISGNNTILTFVMSSDIRIKAFRLLCKKKDNYNNKININHVPVRMRFKSIQVGDLSKSKKFPA
uniref:7TM_GPCR_Srx domain-containing protein n=1 Tax=Parastrongyloides trichosuri TaxID=131310 RepID=A0A0N4Z0D1_PARTI